MEFDNNPIKSEGGKAEDLREATGQGRPSELNDSKRFSISRGMILSLVFWIGLGMLILVVDTLVFDFLSKTMAGYDVFTYESGNYCTKYDRCYVDEDWNKPDQKDWQFELLLLDLLSTEDITYESYFGSNFQGASVMQVDEEKSLLRPVQWLLFSGLRNYGAMKMYDSRGNVFKGTDLAAIQSDPCTLPIDGSVLLCKDRLLGFTNLGETLTEKDREKIAEALKKDPDASVVFDRYLLGPESYKNYIPLSVVVRGKDGSEKLRLDVRSSGENTPEGTVLTEEVYVHYPINHFPELTGFRKNQEQDFENWIRQMRQSKDPNADRSMYYGDYPLEGVGPVRRAAYYYEGQELTTYTFFYSSMIVPYLRLFFLLWAIVSLPYWLVVLVIRLIIKRKRRT